MREKLLSLFFKDFHQTFIDYQKEINERNKEIEKFRYNDLIISNLKTILNDNKAILALENNDDGMSIVYRDLNDPTIHVVDALNPNIKLARVLAGFEKKIWQF